jgi:serine/threonine protein kinase
VQLKELLQPKELLKKNSITVVDGKKEVIKVVGTPFRSLTRICCRHEAECLLKFAELGFANAPKLICSTDNSFTMEKIEGTSLRGREFIDEQLFLRLMDVVRELHGFGFAHGNLRPNNILIKDGSEPVLIDFETCCRIHNPLFFLARFSDHVRLHWLWQSRVVQSNPELVRVKFPRYVSLAMLVITPISRFGGVVKTARKRLKRSLKASAEPSNTPSRPESNDVGSLADARARGESRD